MSCLKKQLKYVNFLWLASFFYLLKHSKQNPWLHPTFQYDFSVVLQHLIWIELRGYLKKYFLGK